MAKTVAKQKEVSPNSVDYVLKQTEIGSLIAKNKIVFIVLVVMILLGVIGWGGYSMYHSKMAKKYDMMIHQFSLNYLKKFEDKEIDHIKFSSEFDELVDKAGDYRGIMPIVLKSVDLLVERKKIENALSILEKTRKNFLSSNAYINYILGARLAVLYEDLNRPKEAIKILESFNASSVKLLEAKNHFDLGRLYFAVGDKEKAKMNFLYLIENFTNNEFIKVAKLYLEELKSK